MEIKVRAVEAEEKSTAQVEQELLDKKEQQDELQVQEVVEDKTEVATEEATPETNVEEVESTSEAPSSELSEEDVLSFIKNRYDKDVASVGQLFEERESNEELPEDVAAYFEYKKKTGRGIEDYVKLNRDFDAMDENQLLSEYLLSTGEAIDKDDVELLMDEYSYDEEVDEDRDIKKAKLAKKKAIVKAKKFFKEQKEMYKQPLESSTDAISESDKEALNAYNQYVQQAKTQEEENKRKRDWFLKKTDEVFHSEFKGFDFKVGEDKMLTFLPSKDVQEIKKSNSDSMNLIKKFMNEETGLLEDVLGYHRAIAIAKNPERFAKFFYEQGKADATEDVARKMKNVKMTDQAAPQVTRTKDGMQIRSVSKPSSKGLKIRSLKK